jgi:uncharacterized membrane protein YdjX (TVP38/TMEM64 family)
MLCENNKKRKKTKEDSRCSIKFRIFFLILLIFIVVSLTVDVDASLSEINSLIENFGWWSPVAFVALFLVVTTFVASATFMTLSAAILFSPVKALAVVWVSSILASSLQFLLARYLARNYISRKLHNFHYADKVERFVDKYGTLAVALSRLIPFIPFNLLNFIFGTLNISFFRYIIWSSIFMLPSATVYIYGARTILGILTGDDISGITVFLVVIGVLFLGLLSYLIKKHFFK